MIDTHFFYRPPALDPFAFKAFIADVRRLIAAAPANIELRGREGFGKPEVSVHRVALNGDASCGAEHEPLILEQTYTLRPPSRMREGVFFDFCKTNGKSYDLVVVAVLYAFLYHFPSCKFVSDSSQDELKPGFDLFFAACNPHGEIKSLFHRPIKDRD